MQNLYECALFLHQLRQKLPRQYQLSITNLLDWTSFRDAPKLANNDEMSIQTGIRTAVDYETSLQHTRQLGLAFKVGLVQHGRFNPHLNYQQSPLFKDHILLLLRTKPRF
ncbi:DUF3142 domain-containing protein [Acinetobacter bohemicus]|nr:DUF3142 domain-containing protein [Acinetobacter sp. S4397-1]